MSNAICPSCGSPIDYCQGHGEIGDPEGRKILDLHDDENHIQCHENSECKLEEALDRLTTIDQLPEVGPDYVKETDTLLDFINHHVLSDGDDRTFASTIYRETVERAVTWNP